MGTSESRTCEGCCLARGAETQTEAVKERNSKNEKPGEEIDASELLPLTGPGQELEAANQEGHLDDQTFPPTGQPLERIADALPADTALAEYAVSAHKEGERYVVFVITGDPSFQVKTLDIGAAADIDTQIQEFRRLLGFRSLPFLRFWDTGSALREILLDPVVKVLGPGAKHLLVVPDGELATLPFAALPSGEGQFAGKYVLNWDLNIGYLTSARDLLPDGRSEPKAKPNRSVVIANPDYGSTAHEAYASKTCGVERGSLLSENGQRAVSFKDLPGTEKEGQSVKDLLQDADLLTGRSATVKALLGVSRPRVLHVAAHGFFLGERAGGKLEEETVGRQTSPLLRSGVALAGAGAWQEGWQPDPSSDNGIATSLDLLSMDLEGTELATISARQSGLRDSQVGQAVSGLGRSLKLAGAERVVLTLWDTEDEVAAEVMKNFYTALREQEEAGAVHRYSEAMRAAQRKLLQDRRNENLAHGAQWWGAFVVYGI